MMTPLSHLYKTLFSVLLFAMFSCTPMLHSQEEVTQTNKKTIEFSSTNDLSIHADIYEADTNDQPIILLFHQAGFSRGEYLEIAPKLQALGYTCIAIDQRSGGSVNGVVNQTKKQAKDKGLGTKYPDAYPDLEAALDYAKSTYKNRKLIVWGSSYSSSLVFVLASKHPEIAAVLSFSPGEYFEFENKKVADFAKEVHCPVFITSARNEDEAWANIFAAIPSKEKTSFLPETKGFHGSKALWNEKEGHEAYWVAVTTFLQSL